MSSRSDKSDDGKGKGLDRFALVAMSILAEDVRMTGQQTKERRQFFVKELYRAVSSPNPGAGPAFVQKMLKLGTDPVELAGYYIPEVARQLGEAWCTDMMDFANVTIGSARLQGLLRTLGPEWCGEDLLEDANSPKCLVLVPEDAQHTLGALIMAGQLRRKGLAVTLEIGKPFDELTEMLAANTYDVIMISASARESLDVVRSLVQKLSRMHGDGPVIVGGSVITLAEDVASLTGADLATSDLDEALEFCGFDIGRAPAKAQELLKGSRH